MEQGYLIGTSSFHRSAQNCLQRYPFIMLFSIPKRKNNPCALVSFQVALEMLKQRDFLLQFGRVVLHVVGRHDVLLVGHSPLIILEVAFMFNQA